MKNSLIAMSCLVFAASVACTSTPARRTTTGTGGTTGAAGSPTGAAGTPGGAGTTGAAGDQGTAGTPAGAAGTTGAAGNPGTQGTAGTTGAAGDGTAGTGVAGTTGAAGTGAAGTTGAGGTGAPIACMNSTVVSAGGMESNCTAKTTWKATAMPTPAHRADIPDSALMPQYAIDGMTATRYSSGMTMAAGFYFQVDLGAMKMVSGIIVDTSEGADVADVADGYDVSVSTDGTDFTKIVASCMYSAASLETINFTATAARYVRYTNKGAPVSPPNGATSWLSIHEFDILCN